MKILQINTVSGFGSTGRIAIDIAQMIIDQGHECCIAYGRGTAPVKYQSISRRIGSDLNNKVHGLQTRIFDLHGFGSKNATKSFLRWVDEYNPDLIHLHNIHGYYLNLELLFAYLKKCGKPVVWTLHDCWAFTGHCAHFSAANCNQWETGCKECSQLHQYPATYFAGNVANNFRRKKEAFTGVPNLTIVTPSHWLASVVKQSFLRDYDVNVIYNGVDLDVFRPVSSNFREKNGIADKTILLGVANIWNERKGLNDFIELEKMLDEQYKIVLVGLDDQQMKSVPDSILKIKRTNSVEELAEIYASADVYINPSVEETMGLTTAEALACGTPVITYDKTAVPEIADDSCGIVVHNSPAFIKDALEKLSVSKEACLTRAQIFEKQARYQEYYHLYRKILGEDT